MFADQLTVTVNAVAKVLNRINQDKYGSEYFLRESTQEFRLKIRNSSSKPAGSLQTIDRHNFELTNTVYATSTVPAIVRRAYSVYENSRSDTAADPLNVFVGFAGFNSSANIQKALNYES